MPTFDYILVGGGLQNALLTLALRARQERAKIAILERDARLGGNHTWCFHAGDVTDESQQWVAPLVVQRWPGYEVRFPGFERRIERSYAAITSERLHAVVLDALNGAEDSLVEFDAEVVQTGPHGVRLANGTEYEARAVIDSRGPERGVDGACGFQKFLGLELELSSAHGVDTPILMDATVEQQDGFRFMYTLPLSPTRLLVEDTYFSNVRRLDRETTRSRILDYVAEMGLAVNAIVREEEGSLPMPWRQSYETSQKGPLLAGYRGGFFHPGTGYSLPVAVRLAEQIASRAPEDLHSPELASFAREHRRSAAFCHLLNSMLFRWFPPEQRWHVFERFYRLPLETIERFYALRMRAIDRARLVVGRPPRGMSLRYRLAKGGHR